MDYEMPVMDGITAVRQIMQRQPTPVLMFSSLTYEGARVSLDALDAGAADYLPKNFEDISRHPEKVRQLLCERVHALARSNRRSLGLGAAAAPVASSAPASARQPLDRKSTRLNSSHVRISYAVFCLKKKKKT